MGCEGRETATTKNTTLPFALSPSNPMRPHSPALPARAVARLPLRPHRLPHPLHSRPAATPPSSSIAFDPPPPPRPSLPSTAAAGVAAATTIMVTAWRLLRRDVVAPAPGAVARLTFAVLFASAFLLAVVVGLDAVGRWALAAADAALMARGWGK